ncbi:hypothetical protein [Sphingomonas sp. ERG5]|uniref:hypothetical protein n=1 Tax=Sphingomonas sp. ERG5 TaxID=1381597 RepID=UPI00054C5BC3|nr:hypothetical protein [Sphingomonas sp. ERG5]
MMKAKTRLYLTADRLALVLEGDTRAATLYATPGDDIPDSAAERYGLVDGALGDAPTGEPEGVLRVATFDGETVEVAGYRFGAEWFGFRDSDLDEGQLLAILKEQSLNVEAALLTGPSRFPDYVPFPGRAGAITALQAHVDYDLAHGRPHDRVGLKSEDYEPHPAEVSPPPAPPPPPPVVEGGNAAPTGAAQATPAKGGKAVKAAETKEKSAPANKEAKASENKGAGAGNGGEAAKGQG